MGSANTVARPWHDVMKWHISHPADPLALPIADRHYNRQKIGSSQFVPPGRCVVLLTSEANALWVTSWPFAEYVKHQWPGAWICSCFRNESPFLSSELIQQAVSATRSIWPNIPTLGMVTFVDPTKVRKKRDFGRCYRKAGFVVCGQTKGGLIALQITPEIMPEPMLPLNHIGTLFSDLPVQINYKKNG